MKICYISCSAVYGGVEKIIVETLNALSKQHHCRLIVPKGCRYLSRLDPDIDVYEYRAFDKRYNPFLHLEMAKMTRGYEIVHTHGAKATVIISRIQRFCAFKHIATKHNNRKGKIFNRISRVISVSKAVAQTISHPSETIYFGIPQSPIQATKKLSDTPFTLIAIGRLDEIKGFDALIEQVAKLDFPFQLNIIGEGKERQNLQQLIGQKQLDDRVFLLGFQDNIPERLSHSHIQVISSRNEGLPLTLLEGLMNSPVIISTPVGGIGEVLSPDFLVDIEDFPAKLSEVHTHYPSYCQTFHEQHFSKKQLFTFENYLQHLTDYYTT